jgi:HSP20 family protein
LLDEMGSILRRYNLWPSRGMETYGSFVPQVEVIENDKNIHVDAELPGVEEKDIDVTLTPDTLTISGDKKVEFKHSAEDVCCTERSFGSFSRTIPLPDSVDVNKAEAVYHNGVLCINLPKLEGEMATKKIPIKHAGT